MFNNIFTSLLITALVWSSSSAALLNVGSCSIGPSYWCESIKNAKQCGAVKHCIQTSWTKQQLPEDNDDICTICKNMVEEARDQLESNETQEELKQVFEGSCKLIPIKEISDECIKLSDEFIPELIETLASQMNPQAVCMTAGLCNSRSVDRLLSEYKESHPNVEIVPEKWRGKHPFPGDCDDCKDFVFDTIRLVRAHDKTETLKRLLAICGRLGSLSDGCMGLVEANFDSIYNYLSNELKPQDFCDLVGMCERMYGKKKVPFLKENGDEACDFCVSIVHHWRDVLTANTTELEFKEILDGLCKQSGSFAHECLSLVDSYYLPLYQLLMSEVHPKEICEAVGLCGINSVFAPDNLVPIWSLQNLRPQDTLPVVNNFNEGKDNRIIGMDESNSFNKPASDTLDQPKATNIKVTSVGNKGVMPTGDDNMCVMCEFSLHFLQNMLHENNTREEIKEAVEQVCSLMPKTVAEECDDYVDAYGDQIIDLLSQEIDPSVVCTMLGLCHKKVKKVEGDGCVLCEFAMNQLEDLIKDNKTEAAIRHNLENLCVVLPKTIRKDCTAFVDQYADQVIQLLIDDLDPDQVCTAIGLCNKVSSSLFVGFNPSYQLPVSRLFVPALQPVKEEPPKEKKVVLKQSTECVLCEFVMKEIDEKITNKATMDEIERAVEYICSHLPGTIQEDCIGFIDEYGDSIIELISQELDPKEVCKEISLCKPSDLSKFFKTTVDLNVDKCLLCEEVVNFVDEKLQDPETTSDIDALLEKICYILPQKARKDCRDIIEVYGPYVVNMLEEFGHDKKKVCQAVELCPNSSNKVLLGAKKCTWGPSYWCQTQLHAKACKATSHCEEKVWLTSKPLV